MNIPRTCYTCNRSSYYHTGGKYTCMYLHEVVHAKDRVGCPFWQLAWRPSDRKGGSKGVRDMGEVLINFGWMLVKYVTIPIVLVGFLLWVVMRCAP